MVLLRFFFSAWSFNSFCKNHFKHIFLMLFWGNLRCWTISRFFYETDKQLIMQRNNENERDQSPNKISVFKLSRIFNFRTCNNLQWFTNRRQRKGKILALFFIRFSFSTFYVSLLFFTAVGFPRTDTPHIVQ
jgi:hypothetical protein